MDERPAPVVTIIDPSRPGPLVEVVAGEEKRPAPWLRPAERVLATLVTLCLLAASLGTVQVRAAQHRSAQLERVGFHAFAVGSGTNQARLVLIVQLVNSGGVPVILHDLALPSGWQLMDSPPVRLAGDGVNVLGLGHPVDCTAAPVRPRELEITAEVVGVGRRTVTVPLGLTGEEDAFDTSGLCGRLDAVDAVRVRTSSVEGSGQGVGVTVQLVNTSLAPVVVEDVLIRGFRIRARLPVTLPARAAGVLDLHDLAQVELNLTTVVADCQAARDAVDAAFHSETPDDVEVLVSGRGGLDIATVNVTGIQAYLARELRERCGSSR